MPDSYLEAFAEAHRAGQRAFNRGDFEKAFAGLAPDVEWHVLASLPDADVLRGPDAVVRYFAGVREGLEWRVEAQEFIDAGAGRVVVHQRGRAVGRTTRIAGSRDFFQLWEMRADGLVHRVREYETRDAAMDAAGLP